MHLRCGWADGAGVDMSVLGGHSEERLKKGGRHRGGTPIEIVTGNPGVSQGYLYPYPRKPIPAPTGTGFNGLG